MFEDFYTTSDGMEFNSDPIKKNIYILSYICLKSILFWQFQGRANAGSHGFLAGDDSLSESSNVNPRLSPEKI